MQKGHLIDKLRSNTSSVLDLSGNGISDDDVQEIVNFVLKNRKITAINLSNNTISDKSIAHLETLLNRKQGLTSLKLQANAFSSTGVSSLSEYLKNSLDLLEFEADDNLMDEYTQQLIIDANNVKKRTMGGLVNSHNDHLRNLFLEEYWLPFRNTLIELLYVVKLRKEKHFDMADRLPSAQTLRELSERCYQLTEIWYGQGRGNIAMMYLYFHAMCEAAQISCYSYRDLAIVQSPDGYLSSINAVMRNQLQENYDNNIKNPYLKAGGIVYRGKKEIDTVVNSNLILMNDAQRLLLLDYMKKLTVDWIRKEQFRLLKTLLLDDGTNLEKLNQQLTKENIENIINRHVKTKQVTLEATPLPEQLLIQYSEPIQNWGQLPQHEKEAMIDTFNEYIIQPQHHEAEDEETKLLYDAIETYANTLNSEPGELIHIIETYSAKVPELKKLNTAGDIQEFLKVIGILSGKLALITENRIDTLNVQREIDRIWVRIVDLKHLNEFAALKILQGKGAINHSKIRVNTTPNRPRQGFAVSPHLETLKQHHSTHIRDIEALIQESMFLCPAGDFESLLPGEAFIDCHWQPRSESNQKQSQYINIAEGVGPDFKLFSKSHLPIAVDKIKGTVDLIPISEKKLDACMLKVVAKNFLTEEMLNFLQDTRVYLLACFGGEKSLDFYLHFFANGDGNHTFIMIPMAALVSKENGALHNLDNHTSQRKYGMPVRRLPEGNAPEDHPIASGLETLQEFYEFTAKPDMFKVLKDYLKEKIADLYQP